MLSDSGGLGAFDEEIGEHFFVGLVGADHAVFGLEFVAAGFHAVKEFAELAEVLFADDAGLGDDAVGSFEIDEADGAVELEVNFGLIQKVEHSEVMFAKAQVLERLKERFSVAKQIRENNNQTAGPDFLSEIVERLDEAGFTSGLLGFEMLED